MDSLEKLEKFVSLLHKVQTVKRVARRPNEREMTTTAEHSFELAMVCWYIASINKLDLNFEKILKYALAHDVIEAYAGDTPMFDEKAKETKALREADALKMIEGEFAQFSDMINTMHEYEERKTPEAKFVYATDKLVDPLDASMEETSSIWKEFNVSLETMLNYKNDKIALSKDVLPYWNLLVKKLNDRKSFFFNQ